MGTCMCYQCYLQALLHDWLKPMEMAPWRYRWIYFCLPHLPRIDFMFNNRRPQKSWRMWESRLPCSTMFATVSWKRRDSVAMFGEKYICHVLEGYSSESFQLAETSFHTKVQLNLVYCSIPLQCDPRISSVQGACNFRYLPPSPQRMNRSIDHAWSDDLCLCSTYAAWDIMRHVVPDAFRSDENVNPIGKLTPSEIIRVAFSFSAWSLQVVAVCRAFLPFNFVDLFTLRCMLHVQTPGKPFNKIKYILNSVSCIWQRAESIKSKVWNCHFWTSKIQMVMAWTQPPICGLVSLK
jgi:hypothetical protein